MVGLQVLNDRHGLCLNDNNNGVNKTVPKVRPEDEF